MRILANTESQSKVQVRFGTNSLNLYFATVSLFFEAVQNHEEIVMSSFSHGPVKFIYSDFLSFPAAHFHFADQYIRL